MPVRTAKTPYLIKEPKGYTRFKTLLPYDGFVTLKPEDFKEMMKIIHNEPDKKQKNIYFTQVLDKLFAGGWGWYMRLGQSLSGRQPIEHASQLPDKKRDAGLAVLRMIKEMHIELHYQPNYVPMINQFIREFGGQTMSKEQKAQQNQQKFLRGVIALKAGAKLPRKMKKNIKSQLEKTR